MSEQSKNQPNPQNKVPSEQNKATFSTAQPYQNNTSPNNFTSDPYRTNEMPTQPMPQNNPVPQQGTMFNPYPNQPYNQAYPQQNNPQYPQYPQNQPDPRYQGSYPSYDPNQPPYQQPYQQPYEGQYQQPYQQYDPNYQQPYQQYDPNYQQPYEGQYQQPYQQYDPNYQQQYDPNQQPTRQGIDLNEIKVNFDPKTASALSYVLFFISGLYFFFTTEKENRFVRFHAMQSILFSAAWVVVFFVSNIIIISISGFFAVIGLSFMLKLVGVFSNLITLGLVATWIYSMYQAYQGNYWKLPIIGDMAEKQVDAANL